MALAKLDMYDYLVMSGIIRINIDSKSDPILVDIFTDVTNSGGYIYVEGGYYKYLDDYEIASNGGNHWVDLSVAEIDNSMMGDGVIV